MTVVTNFNKTLYKLEHHPDRSWLLNSIRDRIIADIKFRKMRSIKNNILGLNNNNKAPSNNDLTKCIGFLLVS